MSGQSELQRPLAQGHTAAVARHRPVPAASAGGPDDLETFAECGGFLKTQARLDIPDIQLHFRMAMADDHGRKAPSAAPAFTCPRLPAAAEEPRAPVALGRRRSVRRTIDRPELLCDEADLETMVAGFKTTRRLMETPALKALQKKEMYTEGVHTDDDIRSLLRQARRYRLSPGRHPARWASTIPSP